MSEKIYQFSNNKVKKFKAIAYVDGSFNAKTNSFTYGLVFIYKNEDLQFFEKFQDEQWSAMRNVAGEVMGAVKAMQIAIAKNIDSLMIYHDYMGIEKWCTGKWRTNKPGTIAYRNFYDQARKTIDIGFTWVKGHSNDLYNDLADQLARRAHSLEQTSSLLIVTPKLDVSDEICFLCNKQLVERTSRYGKFLACSGFPKCKFIKK